MKICKIFGILFFIISRKHIITLYYFKNAAETQKKICAVYTKGAVTDWMSKVVCEVSWYYWHFGQIILCYRVVLFIERCLAASLVSAHLKSIVGDSQHTQNSQINKVIGKLKKCVIYYTEKLNRLFGQPNSSVNGCPNSAQTLAIRANIDWARILFRKWIWVCSKGNAGPNIYPQRVQLLLLLHN